MSPLLCQLSYTAISKINDELIPLRKAWRKGPYSCSRLHDAWFSFVEMPQPIMFAQTLLPSVRRPRIRECVISQRSRLLDTRASSRLFFSSSSVMLRPTCKGVGNEC